MVRPAPGYCHCDTHQYGPEINQYKQLAVKENLLLQELISLNQKVIIEKNAVFLNNYYTCIINTASIKYALNISIKL